MLRVRRTPALIAAATLAAGLAVGLTVAIASPGGVAAAADPIDAAIAASAAPGHTWHLPAATYSHKVTYGVPVRMADGVILRANVDVPTDHKTGDPAPGPFPVLLIMSPYGKDLGGAA